VLLIVAAIVAALALLEWAVKYYIRRRQARLAAD
jgi:hypothetical protein